MEIGTSFLKSKIARRFCTLFILCAFIPTVALVAISYLKVVSQLEEQSYIRLKRDTKSYSLGIFDRLVRIQYDLENFARKTFNTEEDFEADANHYGGQLTEILHGIVLYTQSGQLISLYGDIEIDRLGFFLSPDLITNQIPFIVTMPLEKGRSRIFVGVNRKTEGGKPHAVVGEVKTEYLWGVGVSPLLPPMTELSVFNKDGRNIMASAFATKEDYHELERLQVDNDLRVFQYYNDGEEYFASLNNLFLESRFQRTGWIIVLSKSRANIMAALDQFKLTFPFIVLFFLLLILYLSVNFIRKGLEPLEELKRGTKRVAEKDFSKKVEIASNDEFQDLGESFNKMSGTLSRQFNTMEVLADIDRSILSSLKREKVLSTSLQRFKSFFNSDLALYIQKANRKDDFAKIYNLGGERISDLKIKYYEIDKPDLLKLFGDKNHTFMSGDDVECRFLQRISGNNIRAFLSLPLGIDKDADRTLLLGWENAPSLEDTDLTQARKIANQLAIALKNTQQVEAMEKLAIGTIEALARTVDAKSRWTAGHSERVAEMSGRVAKALGMSSKEIDTIQFAGLLHDIGKIGIPLSILDKPDRLTDQEYSEVQMHPEIGAKILEPIEAFHNTIPVIHQHHEKYDGTGYPQGLKGDEIHISARIMSVVDVWDAVVSDRPYREGWVGEKAVDLITKGSGTHFDPIVVEAFLGVVGEDHGIH